MEQLRSAGSNERRCIARDRLSLYGYIVTLATYRNVLPGAERLPKDLLYKLLKQCITRHPILGAVIQGSATEKPWLARPSAIRLDRHVLQLDSSHGQKRTITAMLEHVHNTAVVEYEDRPQWKVFFTQDDEATFHLAFACSHALLDGRSGFFFHQTFLDALSSSRELQFDSDPVFYVPKEGRVLPPLEIAGNLAISWSFLLGPLINEYMPSWIARAIGMQSGTSNSAATSLPWTGAPSRPTHESAKLPTTAVHTAELPHELVRKVLSACKIQRVRLTGLLLHFTTRSLSRALELQGQDFKTFKVGTAIDLRKCIPGIENEMGVLVSATEESITLEPTFTNFQKPLLEDDWPAIRNTTERLEKASSTLADQPVGLLKYLSNYKDWTSRKAASPADSSFEISNLGRLALKTSETTKWNIDRVAFSQSADATGAPFSVNVASVDNGPLQIVLSWWPGMLGVKGEGRLAADICDGILQQMQLL